MCESIHRQRSSVRSPMCFELARGVNSTLSLISEHSHGSTHQSLACKHLVVYGYVCIHVCDTLSSTGPIAHVHAVYADHLLFIFGSIYIYICDTLSWGKALIHTACVLFMLMIYSVCVCVRACVLKKSSFRHKNRGNKRCWHGFYYVASTF